MYPLLRAFAEVCLLRRGPQDLPASLFLLYATLVLYGAAGLVLAAAYYALGAALLLAVSDTALVSGLSYLLLRLQGRTERFPQTLTALAGTGALLQVLALGPALWFGAAQATNGDTTVPGLLGLALLMWGVVVMGHIWRHALSAPLLLGVVVAVIFHWVGFSVQSALVPVGP